MLRIEVVKAPPAEEEAEALYVVWFTTAVVQALEGVGTPEEVVLLLKVNVVKAPPAVEDVEATKLRLDSEHDVVWLPMADVLKTPSAVDEA